MSYRDRSPHNFPLKPMSPSSNDPQPDINFLLDHWERIAGGSYRSFEMKIPSNVVLIFINLVRAALKKERK